MKITNKYRITSKTLSDGIIAKVGIIIIPTIDWVHEKAEPQKISCVFPERQSKMKNDVIIRMLNEQICLERKNGHDGFTKTKSILDFKQNYRKATK